MVGELGPFLTLAVHPIGQIATEDYATSAVRGAGVDLGAVCVVVAGVFGAEEAERSPSDTARRGDRRWTQDCAIRVADLDIEE